MEEEKAGYGISTNAIHAGQEPEKQFGAVTVPIYLATTYSQPEPGKPIKYDYIRFGNPTQTALIEQIAAIEGAKHAEIFNGHMACFQAIVHLFSYEGHFIFGEGLNPHVLKYIKDIGEAYQKFNFDLVDLNNEKHLELAIQENTKMVYFDNPSNPYLNLHNLEAISKICREKGILTVLDASMALSSLQQEPFKHGIDVVINSMENFGSGHNDTQSAAILTNDDELIKKLSYFKLCMGNCSGPIDCYLTQRGLKTIKVRANKQISNALAVAEFLSLHTQVAQLFFPGKYDNVKDKELLETYSKNSGSVMTFVLKTGSTKKFVNALKFFNHSEGVNGVDSTVLLVGKYYTAMLGKNAKILNLSDTMIRVSVGIEHIDDLLGDLAQAFAEAAK